MDENVLKIGYVLCFDCPKNTSGININPVRNMYIYIYIYMCVCVCVSGRIAFQNKSK